jgi:hypothetical protein
MQGWWDSPDTLAQLTTWLRVAIFVFGLLTAIATGLTIKTTNRIDTLRAQERTRLAERLAEAERRAAEAERQAAEAQQRTAPRTLAPAQAQALVTALEPVRGKQLAVVTLTNDGEASLRPANRASPRSWRSAHHLSTPLHNYGDVFPAAFMPPQRAAFWHRAWPGAWRDGIG